MLGQHRFGLGVLTAVLSAGPLCGQVNTATILGTVTDPTGAHVAKARVTVLNEATGFTRGTETDADGSYLLPYSRLAIVTR